MTPPSTKADPNGTGWAINDPVSRLRVFGSEHVFDLTAADHWVLGSSPECSIQLVDPSGRVSRQHAALSRDGDTWTMEDQDSVNGLRLNGDARQTFQLAPADELQLGGITLIAESRCSIELHDLLRRWLGWSNTCLSDVDRALRDVREMANLRATLILRGPGSLAGIARRLHKATLHDRPFVVLAPDERGVPGLDRAANGMLCVDTRALPRDISTVVANINKPGTRVRLVVFAETSKSVAELAAMISRVVTVRIPPLARREDEIERLLETYGLDAAEEMGAPHHGFRPRDPNWIRAHGVKTLDEIEDAARRLVALRNYGVSEGAKRLGIDHSNLSRWALRRKLPT